MNANDNLPTPGQIKAVAFDLDGTLVDSAPDIAAALSAALQAAALEPFDLATVRSWIGDGPDVLIAHALKRSGLTDASQALRTQLRCAFDTHTLAEPLAHGRVYPGVAELLHALQGVFPMVVVTNKPTPLARAVLAYAGLLPFMSAVHGADTPALRKPAPALLIAAAQQLGVACENLLMVGDGTADLNAARNAGCHAALVAWGYGTHTVPDDAYAWRIHKPQHLQDLLLGRHQRAVAD